MCKSDAIENDTYTAGVLTEWLLKAFQVTVIDPKLTLNKNLGATH